MGVGLAGVFTIFMSKVQAQLSTYYPWQLMIGSFGATLLTIMLGSVLSIRKVIKVQPGVVFSS